MMRASSTRVRLDRAHLESRVIVSNLQHLELVLGEEDRGLRDELKVFATAFERYVGRLGDASSTASKIEESRNAAGRHDPGPDTA